ncbi:hypothetical protein H6770_00210 [Candidatus Peribacteria bacterium]|nr:hypothetical protein [Candidatus Peribacteria bacterium]
MTKFTLDTLGKIVKVLIFPFFFFISFIAGAIVIGIMSHSFEKNFYESVASIAIATVYVAPIAFTLLAFISLIFLKFLNKMHILANDSFLLLWGCLMGITTLSLFFAIEKIESVLFYLF